MYVPDAFHLPPIEVAISSLKLFSESGVICAMCAYVPSGVSTCMITGEPLDIATCPVTLIVSPADYDSLLVVIKLPSSSEKLSILKNGINNNAEKVRSQNLLNLIFFHKIDHI